MEARTLLISLHVRYNGNWFSILKDIQNKVIYDEEETKKLAQDFEKKHKRVITIVDEDYPDKFKKTMFPPFVLVKN